MNEDEAYLEIAERFIESANQHLLNNINIQEVIGFKTYHAFESIGGAFNSHLGHTVPRGHARKLNLFVQNARSNRLVDSRAIATIAMTLNSMRNKYLYPEGNGSGYITPQNQISLTDARNLFRRINGLIRQIKRII